MRHFFFILLFLCAGAGTLYSQNPSCQAFVWPVAWQVPNITTLAAIDSSAAPVSGYVWSNGETTDEITVTGSGTYCVTITYDDGCTASGCYTLSDSCYVTAQWYWLNNTDMQLIAWGWPNYMGTTYQWSNGETSQFIQVSSPGTYCVTITKSNGCTAYTCLDAGALPCELSYWETPDSSGAGIVWLSAQLTASGSASYLWSNGATTSFIQVTQPGDYCVTATDGVGCTESHCFTVACDVSIVQSPAGVTAVPVFGTAPYSYLWNTGETSATINPIANGYFCVTVTDAEGCVSQRCEYVSFGGNICNASIAYNNDNTLTANSTGTAPFAYSWSPGGATDQTIAPTESGQYFVTVTDANGCQDWSTIYWYNPASCEVNILTYTDSVPVSNSAWLFAHTEGNWNDWHWAWSTGDSSSSILVTVGGEYCVTATNYISGCSAVACVWVQPDGACEVEINGAALNTTTFQLTAVGAPDPVATYAWNTGATTPTIEVTASGYYNVTVTNTVGCTVSANTYVYPANTLNVSVFLSNVDSTNNNNNNGVHADIYLIQYDPAQGGILTATDTIGTYSWTNWMAFAGVQNVPPGTYLVKAALKPNSNGYDNYLPTYYDEALLWSEAATVTVNALSSYAGGNNIHINLIEGQNPGGPGFIGGLVSEGANFTGGGNDEAESFGSGEPFPGASVVLTLPDGTPVAATVTNAEGEYSFENLAWGTYILLLDIPGLEPAAITVTIGPAQPSATGVNFEVDENGITLSTQESDIEKLVKVFPNPVRDVLTVELPAPAELTLSNVQGQIIFRARENGTQAKLSVRDLPSGIYFLTARTANNSQVLKVVKE